MKTKICFRCESLKGIFDFYQDKKSKDGFEGVCKVCTCAASKLYVSRNRDVVLKRRAEHYKRNRVRILEEMAVQYKKRKKEIRARHVQNKYGLSPNDHKRLLQQSRGVCAICNKRMKTVCIDHCHKTGRVRGLLCSFCNPALGGFKDSPKLCRKAAEYLEKFL